jgi:hypothetical protein
MHCLLQWRRVNAELMLQQMLGANVAVNWELPHTSLEVHKNIEVRETCTACLFIYLVIYSKKQVIAK